MTNQLVQIIQLFAKDLPGVELYLDPKWASTYSDHRLKIRKHLFKKTKVKSVLDLNNRPKLPHQFVSISHCPVVGGFVISPYSIGIDLEQKKRLSPSVIKRIAKNDEIKLFPEEVSQALWTIKESVYKCAGNLEFNIADVEIQSLEFNSKSAISHLDTQNLVQTNEKTSLKANYLKTISQFKSQSFTTLTWISDDDDMILSISFHLTKE